MPPEFLFANPCVFALHTPIAPLGDDVQVVHGWFATVACCASDDGARATHDFLTALNNSPQLVFAHVAPRLLRLMNALSTLPGSSR